MGSNLCPYAPTDFILKSAKIFSQRILSQILLAKIISAHVGKYGH
jgi:hypothetical protein